MRWFSVIFFALGLALVGGCATTKTLTFQRSRPTPFSPSITWKSARGPRHSISSTAPPGRRTSSPPSAWASRIRQLVLKEDSPEFDRKAGGDRTARPQAAR